jgi:hypothetical protein
MEFGMKGWSGMRGLPGRIGELGVMALVVGGAAGIALWVTSFTATPAAPPPAAVVTAEPFATRFPATLNKSDSLAPPAWIAAAGGAGGQQMAMFAPRLSSPASLPETEARPTVEPVTTGTVGVPSPAAVQRAANRRPTVFNEAQIASIKNRLNLTKDQQEYWPAVEAELRRLAWKKSPDDAQKGPGRRHLVALDVNAVDLAKLQSTTAPLLMSFNDEQKRELRMLAHLAGMQDLFSGL